ncbi:MAG: RNA-dependent RNA polymerase [Sanya rhabdovirus 1]|nr:MAG: RNA-dependent RNA polymerase [Sanya rhabdovirus 1]
MDRISDEEDFFSSRPNSLLTGKRQPNSMASNPHVQTAQDFIALRRMLSPDFKISNKENKSMKPMYDNLVSIIRDTNATQLISDPTPILSKLYNLYGYLDSDTPQIDSMIHNAWEAGCINFENQVITSGFTDKSGLYKSKLSEIIHNSNCRRMLSRENLMRRIVTEQILSYGVVLSGCTRKVFNSKTGAYDCWSQKTTRKVAYECLAFKGFVITINYHWCIILHRQMYFIMPRDFYIMITDVTSQRVNALMASIIAQSLDKSYYLTPTEVKEVWRFYDPLFILNGNDTFKLIKDHEMLATAILLDDESEKLTSAQDYINTLTKDYVESNIRFSDDATSDLSRKMSFLYDLKLLSPHKVSQVFGMAKQWGNPITDPVKTFETLKKVATCPRACNIHPRNLALCTLLERFTNRYIAQNLHWPNVDVSKLPESNVIRKAWMNRTTVAIEDPDYCLIDWLRVDFKTTFQIHDSITLTDLISDKTLSLVGHDLLKSLEETGTIGSQKDRSVLLQWLRTSFVSIKTFLDDVEKNGFTKDNNYMALRIKELELKESGRLFGMATFWKRMYIVVTEALLKSELLKYFPEITIKQGFIELTKHIHMNTKHMSPGNTSKRSTTIVTNMDFEKWNSNMREEDTQPLFSFFSNLFGFKRLYGLTHEMFNDTVFYLSSNNIGYTARDIKNPGLDIKKPCYTGHLGGIEGLRQVGWTTFTLGILFLVVGKEHVNVEILGQGDNQVLVFHYRSKMTDREIRNAHNNILDKLEHYVSLVGPPLKREETWSSSVCFMFGKRIIFKGVELNQSPKRLFKMNHLSSEGLPTCENAISSLGANAAAAAQTDVDGLVPFFVYSIRSALTLYRHLTESYVGSQVPFLAINPEELAFNVHVDNRLKEYNYGEILKTGTLDHVLVNNCKAITPAFISSLLLFPSILGGLPILYYNQLLIRKFPDPLVEAISILSKILVFAKSPVIRKFINNILHPGMLEHVKPIRVFLDPLSLNLPVPELPADSLKRQIAKAIAAEPGFCNEQYKDVYLASEANLDELGKLLYTMKPMRFLLGHEILAMTPTMYAREVVNQFSNTQILIQLLVVAHGEKAIERLRLSDNQYFSSILFGMLSCFNYGLDDDCSSNYAYNLRCYSWKVDDQTGIETAYPFEAFEMHSHVRCEGIDESLSPGYILVKFDPDMNTNQVKNVSYLGPFTPLLGASTTQKYIHRSKEWINEQPPQLKKVANTYSRLTDWAYAEHSNLGQLAMTIIKSSTDFDVQPLKQAADQISGQQDHRTQSDKIDRGGSTPISFNFTTGLSITTDLLPDATSGEKNVTLMFQAIFSAVASVGSTLIWLQSSKMRGRVLHLHVSPCDCIKDINESYSDIDTLPNNVSNLVPSYPKSPFCFVSKESVTKEHKTKLVEYPVLKIDYDTSDFSELTKALNLASNVVALSISRRFARQSMEIFDGKFSASKLALERFTYMNKTNFHITSKMVTQYLLSFLLFKQLEDHHIHDTGAALLARLTNKLSAIPPDNFNFLSLWFQCKGFREYLTKELATQNLSRGAIWLTRDINQDIRSLLVHHASVITQEGSFIDFDVPIVAAFTNGSNHPMFMRAFFDLLKHRNDDYIVPQVSKLILIKRTLQQMKTGEFNWNFNLKQCLLDSNLCLTKNITEEMRHTCLKFLQDMPDIYVFDGIVDWVITAFSYQNVWEDDPTEIVPYKHPIPSCYLVSHPTFRCLEFRTTRMFPLPDNVEELLFKPNKTKAMDFDTNITEKRGASANTGAACKILSFIHEFDPYVSDDPTCILGDFGGGSGNMSKQLMLTYPHKKIFFNSLIDHANVPPNTLQFAYPCGMADSVFFRSRLYEPKVTYEGLSDFLDPKYPDYLKKELPKETKIECFIVDIEGKPPYRETQFMIALNSIKISELFNTKMFIIKTFFSDINLFYELISMFNEVGQVSIIRSGASSKLSSEVYVKVVLRFPRNHFVFSFLPNVITYESSYELIDKESLKMKLLHLKEQRQNEDLLKTYEDLVQTWIAQDSLERSLSVYFPSFLAWMKKIQEGISKLKTQDDPHCKRPKKYYLAFRDTINAHRYGLNPVRFGQTHKKGGSISILSPALRERLVINVLAMMIFTNHKYSDIQTWIDNGGCLVIYSSVIGTVEMTLAKELKRLSYTKAIVIRFSKEIQRAIMKKLVKQKLCFIRKYGDFMFNDFQLNSPSVVQVKYPKYINQVLGKMMTPEEVELKKSDYRLIARLIPDNVQLTNELGPIRTDLVPYVVNKLKKL